MSKKVSAISIYIDWCNINSKQPEAHYRLGQHYCNVLGLRDTVFNGVDLFEVVSIELADKVFYDMCEYYQWDLFDLPIFSEE